MKYTTSLFLLSLLLFSCENKKQLSHSKKGDSYKEKISSNKIRFEKVFEYEYRFGKPDTTTGFLIELIEYDTSGNVIKSESFNKEEFLKQFDKIEEYKYDSNGNNIEIISKNKDGKITSIIKNIFSEKGINTERLFYDPDGKLTGKVLYKHDNYTNVTELISYENDGTIEYKIQFRYDDKGDEIFYKRLDKTGKIVEKSERISSNDSLQTYQLYDSTNNISWKSEIKINSNRNMIERVDIDMESNQKSITKYKYDDNNFIIEIIEIKSHGEPQSHKKIIREEF